MIVVGAGAAGGKRARRRGVCHGARGRRPRRNPLDRAFLPPRPAAPPPGPPPPTIMPLRLRADRYLLQPPVCRARAPTGAPAEEPRRAAATPSYGDASTKRGRRSGPAHGTPAFLQRTTRLARHTSCGAQPQRCRDRRGRCRDDIQACVGTPCPPTARGRCRVRP